MNLTKHLKNLSIATKGIISHVRWLCPSLGILAASLILLSGCSTLKPMQFHNANLNSNENTSPLTGLIRFYQGPLNHLSAVRMGECPMEPSCSNYALQAIHKHGFLLGWFMACDRLIRCGRDEIDLSPKVIVYGEYRCLDPVAANDEWLGSDPVN